MKNTKHIIYSVTLVFILSFMSIFVITFRSAYALEMNNQKPETIPSQLIISYYSGNSFLQGFGIQPADGSRDELAGSCTPLPGAIAYWKLDSAVSTGNPDEFSFEDFIGNKDGICTEPNCPSITQAGKVNGGALFLALEKDRINVPSAVNFDWQNTDSFTIEAWIKTNQDCTENKVFLGRYRSTGSAGGFGTWWLGCSPGGFTSYRLRDSENVVREVIGAKLINDGKWHYLVGVRDGSKDENRLYVDGKPDGTLTAPTYNGNFVSDTDITFGYYDNKYYFDGVLDEVGIYGRALSASEISERYSNCSGPAMVFLPLVVKP